MNDSPNRYEIENAIDKIYGYFIACPNEPAEATFERAKNELLENLQRQIEICANISAERYFYHK